MCNVQNKAFEIFSFFRSLSWWLWYSIKYMFDWSAIWMWLWVSEHSLSHSTERLTTPFTLPNVSFFSASHRYKWPIASLHRIFDDFPFVHSLCWYINIQIVGRDGEGQTFSFSFVVHVGFLLLHWYLLFIMSLSKSKALNSDRKKKKNEEKNDEVGKRARTHTQEWKVKEKLNERKRTHYTTRMRHRQTKWKFKHVFGNRRMCNDAYVRSKRWALKMVVHFDNGNSKTTSIYNLRARLCIFMSVNLLIYFSMRISYAEKFGWSGKDSQSIHNGCRLFWIHSNYSEHCIASVCSTKLLWRFCSRFYIFGDRSVLWKRVEHEQNN